MPNQNDANKGHSPGSAPQKKKPESNHRQKNSRQKVGAKGEELAVLFLNKLGYSIEERNYKGRHAEIDIICIDPCKQGMGREELVFVEVKTRTSGTYGDPADAVSPRKTSLMRRAAEMYLYERDIEDMLCRFDVVAIRLGQGKPLIEHLKDVIDY